MRPTSRMLCRAPASLAPRPAVLRIPCTAFSGSSMQRSSLTNAPLMPPPSLRPLTPLHSTLRRPEEEQSPTPGVLRDIRTFQAPKHYIAQLTKRAQQLFAERKPEEALELWRSLLHRRITPDSPLASILLNGFGQTKYKDGVTTVLRDWLALNMRDASVIFSALFNLERLGEYQAGFDLFEQHRSLAETHEGALTTVLLIYVRLGKLDEARQLQRVMQQKGMHMPPTLWTTLFNSLGAQRRYDDILELVNDLRGAGVKLNDITYSCVVNHLMCESKYFNHARELLRELEKEDTMAAREASHVIIRRLAEAAKRERSYPLLDQAVRRWKGRAKIELTETSYNPKVAMSLGDLAHQLLEIALALSRPLLAEELMRHPIVLRARTMQQQAVMHRKIALSWARTYNISKMMDHYEKATEVMVCDPRAYNYLLAACIQQQAWPVAERLTQDLHTYRVPLTSYLAATQVNLSVKANMPALGTQMWERWLALPPTETEQFTEMYTAMARLVALTGDTSLARRCLQAMRDRRVLPSGFYCASVVEATLKHASSTQSSAPPDLTAAEEVLQLMLTRNIPASVRLHDAVQELYKRAGRPVPEQTQAHLRGAMSRPDTAQSSSYSEFGFDT